MAAGFLQQLAGDRVEVLSAGSTPASEVNPTAVAAMAEEGIDLRSARPKLLEEAAVKLADVVVTMGCGDTCPFFPGKRYIDWEIPDPAGKDLATVRRIRDEVRTRVNHLVAELDRGTSSPLR
jgi:arsenate reductase (thioredoxin)